MIPTQTLARFIHAQEKQVPQSTGELSDLLTSIALGVKIIARLVQTAGFKGLQGYTGRVNVQGEKTHLLDEEADQVLMELLGSSGHFGLLVSEERDSVVAAKEGRRDAKYVVAFDPLDGSSNIGTNIPVGTIFTIFRKVDPDKEAQHDDFLQKGRSIVAAGYSIYGAKVSFVYSCGAGVHGFTLDPDVGEFVLTEEKIVIPDKGKIYSVNEGYYPIWDEPTIKFIESIKKEDEERGTPYSGRYVGSLVSDFDRTIRKGGIFLHPANKKRERGKLRLLYECMPLAFIAEQAGGRAVDGTCDILDIKPQNIHERCPFIAGGKYEIDWFMRVMAETRG
ncbi:MAG: class 1 fructose-bisphosphatase [Candidatus Dadabacteria bacterium]|nr:MAG: class 1 fructose-bisphosphatase [Candidatus Dadabacteria bacterium]